MTFEEAIDKYNDAILAIAETKRILPVDVTEDERKFVQGLLLPSIPREDADRIVEAINDLWKPLDAIECSIIRN